jgi:hypothetical protein
MAPIEIWPQIDPHGKTHTASPLQEMMPNDTGARMISFPPVSPGDIIVEAENKRWRVMDAKATERLRTPIHQELTLHRIPIGDIEYSLPINVDMQNLVTAEDRNFTNPSNLENNGDYSDILATFGRARGTIR